MTRVRRGALGEGIHKNIQDDYRFIVQSYPKTALAGLRAEVETGIFREEDVEEIVDRLRDRFSCTRSPRILFGSERLNDRSGRGGGTCQFRANSDGPRSI